MKALSIVGLTVSNLVFTVVSNISFKLSADSAAWQSFLWRRSPAFQHTCPLRSPRHAPPRI